MKKYPTKNIPISRRQFLRQATSAAAGLVMGSSLASGRTYKGKTRQFSTSTDCDITFFGVADTHYGDFQTIGNNHIINKTTIDHMNYIPGNLVYPTGYDVGFVAEPRAVLVAGDVTDTGTADEWEGFDSIDGFEDDYLGSESTPGRLNWPVYECFGNHDVNGINGTSDYAKTQMRNRTLAGKRPAEANISANGYHYSWNWDNVHFVNLNLYPSTLDSAKNSFDFMVDDLANNVGNSGRAVVLYHHYGFVMIDWWWKDGEMDAYYDAIKDYNIIAIIHGHEHVNHLVSSTWRGINVFGVGLNERDRFGVFRITQNKLFVGECISNTSWGDYYIKNVAT